MKINILSFNEDDKFEISSVKRKGYNFLDTIEYPLVSIENEKEISEYMNKHQIAGIIDNGSKTLQEFGKKQDIAVLPNNQKPFNFQKVGFEVANYGIVNLLQVLAETSIEQKRLKSANFSLEFGVLVLANGLDVRYNGKSVRDLTLQSRNVIDKYYLGRLKPEDFNTRGKKDVKSN